MTLIKELQYKPKSYTDALKAGLNLSDDEAEIFNLIIRDKSIIEISRHMMMSTSTVNRRLANIRTKIKNLME